MIDLFRELLDVDASVACARLIGRRQQCFAAAMSSRDRGPRTSSSKFGKM